MTLTDEEQIESPAGAALETSQRQRLYPNTLPTQSRTWVERSLMGIDTSAGRREFIDDGTHVYEAFRSHWGWWKLQICGWYPYTEERDYWRHDLTGAGRPWLRSLGQGWQELIFRELVLLIGAWNELALPEARYRYEPSEAEPEWMGHWLTLTNEVWRDGVEVLERAAWENSRHGSTTSPNLIEELVRRYKHSGRTWRPIMPERAVYHRKYGERDEYWSFEREDGV